MQASRRFRPHLLVIGLCLFTACGEDTTRPPTLASGRLFYEPRSFCFAGGEGADTLTVYNLGDDELGWAPTHVPAGSQGLDATVTVPPQSFVDLPWTWSPQGAYPIVDSLVVTTSDGDQPRVSLRVRREDPAGFVDTIAPEAPVLLTPEDGAVFSVGPDSVQIPISWSEIDDCSGVRFYVDISLTPDFTQIVCCPKPVPTTTPDLWAYPTDKGVAYWRVTAVDGAGLRGPPSEPRSWTIVD